MPNDTIEDAVSAPHPGQVKPKAPLFIGSMLEAESYFKSPYFQDSYYFPFNPDPLCRGNNYRIYEEMRDDGQVKVALSCKKDSIVNSGWQIECKDRPNVKKFVEDSLKRMQESGDMQMSFEDSVRDMLSAYEFGFSLSEPLFKIKDGKYTFSSVRCRPPQSFRFQVSDRGDVTEVVQMANRGEMYFAPNLFLHHVYQPEYGNPYGKSDLRGVHNDWRAKKFVTKFLAIYLERFAAPTVVGKYPANWDADEVARLQAVLKTIQQTTTLAIPDGAMIEFVQANKDASDTYIKALDYYNMHIARSLLVPDLLGISGSKTKGGSFALGQDQFKLFLGTIDKDRLILSRKITQRLIAPLVKANFGPDIECEFTFTPFSMDDQAAMLAVWADVAKGKVFKPNPEEINHLRREVGFPEGPVQYEVQDPAAGQPVDHPGKAGGLSGSLPKNPGQEPKAPNPNDQRQFTKRTPTKWESKVDFAAIGRTLDATESTLSRNVKRAATKAWKSLVQQVKDSGLIRRFDPARLTELEPKHLREMNQELKHGFRDLLHEAHDEARRELFPKDKSFGLDEGELTLEDMKSVLDAEAFNIAKDYKGLASKKVNSAIAQGLKQGQSEDEIIAAIQEAMPSLTDTWVNTLIRTKTTEIYNRGRKSYFDNDETAQKVVGAYQFSAVLDARTTDVCRNLDKRVFASDDANVNLLTPPLHWNCFIAGTHVRGRGKKLWMNIEDVGVGDFVLTQSRSFMPVEELHKNQFDGELIVLHLGNGKTVKATPNHPVFTKNRGWVEAGKLAVEDELDECEYGQPELLKARHERWIESQRERLIKLYVIEKKGLRAIGKLYGGGDVSGWLCYLGVELRHGSEAVKTQWIGNDARREKTRKSLRAHVSKVPHPRLGVKDPAASARMKAKNPMNMPGVKERALAAKVGMFVGKKNPMYGRSPGHPKPIKYNGLILRSSYEVAFAKFLDRNGIKYEYEPERFDLGFATYVPDFYVYNFNGHAKQVVEVKGWIRQQGIDKAFALRNLLRDSGIQVVVYGKKQLEALGAM